MCFRPAEISMNTCPDCGKMNKPIAKQCIDCGADLSAGAQLIVCPICGVSNPASASECVQCGATEEQIMAEMAKSGNAPKAPGAPKPPMAPGAPKPPMAPGAPKPPSIS